MATPTLARSIKAVVRNGNCSGCGACAQLSKAISMELSDGGFMRPKWQDEQLAADPAAGSERDFQRICPGVSVRSARVGRHAHPTMGPYVSVWMGWATDPETRYAGSSGGVLTAMSGYLLQHGHRSVVGAASSISEPTRTVALQLRSRDDVLAASGSRYAPVANTAAFSGDDSLSAFVGKPCEAYAARRLTELESHSEQQQAPVILSFFCAGVPSQWATEALISHLGIEPLEVTRLRYRGNGWPGHFEVSDRAGQTRQITYEQSWGAHLGTALQERCKICPDGVGEHADIAVGDYWQTDAAGYPLFEDADGVSVAIARTQLGHDLLTAAATFGALRLEPLDLDLVAAVQPTQTRRRLTLAGRLAGRRLGGKANPSFRGFHLVRLGLTNPKQSWRFARGAYSRARKRS